MKVPFTDENNNASLKKVLFDRCVKIVIAKARSGDNSVLTLEYKPNYSNEKMLEGAKKSLKKGETLNVRPIQKGALCTRMEGSITLLPKPTTKNHTPGFTANLRIYNDFDNIIGSTLDTRNKYLSDFGNEKTPRRNALRDYLNNKYWAIVYLGYWNEDKGDADYTKVFAGVINSYFSYRKGVDLITELQCASVYAEQATEEQLDAMFDGGAKIAKTLKDPNASVTKTFESSTDRWDILARSVIQQLATERPNIVDTTKASPVPLEVTAEDRKSEKWFTIDYVNTETANLQNAATLIPSNLVEGYYSARTNFDGVWEDILTIFPNYKVTYKIRDDFSNGVRHYIIMPAGANMEPAKIGGKQHTIYDYQNLLDSPMMSASGGMTINMLLKPDVEAWDWLELKLTKNNKYGTSVGISGEGGNFNMLLYGDRSQTILAAASKNDKIESQYKNGSVFNKPFLIYKVIHTFSTHGSTWKTTVTTTPLIYQQGK